MRIQLKRFIIARMGLRDLFRRGASVKSTDAPSTRMGFSALDWSSFPFWQDQALCRVSKEQALAVPAVLRGRNNIAGVIASLPLNVLDDKNNQVRSPLIEQIDPDVPNSVTLAMTVEDLLFEGISWWRVLARDFYGYPTSARHVDFEHVSFQAPPGYQPDRLPSGYAQDSLIWLYGEPVPVTEVIRFDSPNPALLVSGASAIRRALRLETTAEMYANNPAALEFFTPSGTEDITQAQVTDFLTSWKTARQTGTAAYVPPALIHSDGEQVNVAQLQLIQLQNRATLGIANAMGLDPEDLGMSTTSRTYQNAVDRRQDRINETYGPLAGAIQERLSMGDITRRGQVVRFDWDDFLKANPLDRAQIQATYITNKVITPEEVRLEEGYPAFTAQQKRELNPPTPVVPQQNGQPSVGGNGATQQNQDANMAETPVAHTFSADQDSGFYFDADDVAASFQVNEQARTITGIVVPWNKIGRSGGRRWKFAKDSLVFSKAHVNRIKLLNDHDNSQAVGRVEKTWSDEQGQWATFKVVRGPDGDRALHFAADGVKDGLSVGIGYADSNEGFTFSADPTDKSVRLVTAAPWRETSLTAMPAFDDARVNAVSMSADGGNTAMETNTEVATPVAATFSDTDLTSLADKLFAKFNAEKPTTVNPKAIPVPGTKSGLPLYRFDGKTAERCFTKDLFTKQFLKDDKLREDAEAFLGEQMEAAFANITTSNVSTLNPIINRPDLYVGSLHFSRTIGSMVQGGTVTEITQQKLPKFSSASGMVQSHSEGVEPTEGAFSTTSQTVTPAAIDGLMKINREVVDQGGSPQADQLIWNEMTQFWAELLEKRLVDAFQALSLSDTAVVGTDGDLQTALTTLFAGLQFVAGGDRYRGLALNQDLYTAIANATDNDGRPLFPYLNPTNANGTTAGDYSNVRVGSKVGVPAWALASGNGGPDKSYLFVPTSVYQWFSPPRRIDLTAVAVSYVGIGLWGYSAEFISRNSDVYQLAYTAS